ncbi:MAG: citrate synthase [Oscillospiraceae bacterium]|jgi:citrate synthase|nr:citrate synthase [Oscillospiraceae bacterium]
MEGYSKQELQEQFDALCATMRQNNAIDASAYSAYDVKRGLRNADGTGVMAGLTKICSVDGYYIKDGERVAQPGKLFYRGYDTAQLIGGAAAEQRFGYEETAWLLLFGSLPGKENLELFHRLLSSCRELPEGFVEDMIMKSPSPDIMNKMAHAVLSLYSTDPSADDTSLVNVLRQSIQLIAQLPAIMTYSYQVKRRMYDKRSMYLHHLKPGHSTAETILRTIRADKQFTREEAMLLDVCLTIHADHGGGNNSTFATRVLTSTGTDTYSALAAGIGSLKGPKHGGANIKVSQMLQYMREEIADITDEGQVADYLVRLLQKKAGDRSGLVYGMGHAVYTLSDPRAEILKHYLRDYAVRGGYAEQLALIELVERLAPEIFARIKRTKKHICANVDLYSGLLYQILGIPEDLYTPLFALARTAGWCAHRLEELQTGGRILRPAYKSVAGYRAYVRLEER